MNSTRDLGAVLRTAAHHARDGLHSDTRSMGDSYFPADGCRDYTPVGYFLDLDYDPVSDFLRGECVCELRTAQPTCELSFDLGLQVDAIFVDDDPVSFDQRDGKLVVFIDLEPGAHQVRISYGGRPGDVAIRGERSWLRTPLGALGARMPHAAAFWYPVNDHPSKKATYRTSITLPKPFVAVLPGKLQHREETANKARFEWQSSEPIAPHVYSLAVEPLTLDIHSDAESESQFLAAFGELPREVAGSARESIEETPAIVEWASRHFGAYPFDSLGGIVTQQAGPYALETQTHPIYGNAFFGDGINPYVVAHEIGHQWFGNAVSVSDWSDIWISEGLAAYVSWLWSEESGNGTCDELFSSFYQLRRGDTRYWEIAPGNPSPALLMSAPVYERGAMAVHCLRRAVGDERFFETLRTWTRDRVHRHGSVSDLTLLFNGIADVSELSQEWLFGKVLPQMIPGSLVKPPTSREWSFSKILTTTSL